MKQLYEFVVRYPQMERDITVCGLSKAKAKKMYEEFKKTDDGEALEFGWQECSKQRWEMNHWGK